MNNGTMTPKVLTAGRGSSSDLDALFSLSGLFDRGGTVRLNHSPFLAFIADGDSIRVAIVPQAALLLGYPDETPVMVQWRGQWRSDFFQLTVGDIRAELARS